MVRALASHQCGAGSNPGVDAICGLSLLLVLFFATRRFSPGTPVFSSPQKPTFPKKNLSVDVLPPNRYLLFIIIYLFTLRSPYISIVFPGLKAYSPVRFGELNS